METWKDVENYVGYYQISNNGRIRSLDRVSINKDGIKRILKGKIMNPAIGPHGYYTICLRKKGLRETARIHRLVAVEFIENPNNLPIINHKNEIKTDNRVENLEWASYAYNVNYGTSLERMKRTRKENGIGVGKNHPRYAMFGKDNPCSKPILQFDLDGNFVAEYDSVMTVERTLGFLNGNVVAAARGRYKQAYGYVWRYKFEKVI